MNNQSADKKGILNAVAVEFAWLAVSFIIAAVVCHYLLNWQIDKGTLDIQLYDTYFSLSVSAILLPVFLTVAFCLLFLRGISAKFTQSVTDLVLLVVGFCLISSLIFLSKEVTAQSAGIGWVVYPPLAAIPVATPEDNPLIRLTELLVRSLIAFQLIVTIALGYVAFQWGKQVARVS